MNLEIFTFEFAQRALIASLLIGLVAPLVGTYLVQRRLALLGDGAGHVALTGVGLAILFGWTPIPFALVTATLGMVLIELIRDRSKAAGDLALALVFYGGIAGGVFFAALSPGGTSAALNSYLFGSLTTASRADLIYLALITIIIFIIIYLWGPNIFAVGIDTEIAKVQKIPVKVTAIVLAVLSALTVVVGMRVVGLLLVSAIMIIPVAAAQQITNSFKSTMLLASLLGLVSSVVGLLISFFVDVPPGQTIVMVSLGIFAIMAIAAAPFKKKEKPVAPLHNH
ncbi:MAG: metal ABC transporter permease [Candidatus Nanopelagicales bacterium]